LQHPPAGRSAIRRGAQVEIDPAQRHRVILALQLALDQAGNGERIARGATGGDRMERMRALRVPGFGLDARQQAEGAPLQGFLRKQHAGNGRSTGTIASRKALPGQRPQCVRIAGMPAQGALRIAAGKALGLHQAHDPGAGEYRKTQRAQNHAPAQRRFHGPVSRATVVTSQRSSRQMIVARRVP